MTILSSAQAPGFGIKQTRNSADLAPAGESVVRESFKRLASLHDTDRSKQLRLSYCDQYHFPLPDQHKFPLPKYKMLREYLTSDPRFRIEPARLATREAALSVHAREYVDGFLEGTLERSVMRRIGFPWSPELVRRTLASTGSTLQAVQTALEHGFGGTLAGGTHHAFRDAGAGFCVFNDLAIAVEWSRREWHLKSAQAAGSGIQTKTNSADLAASGESVVRGPIERISVVDLDVHQGDGTASIFSSDPGVFTLSVHAARNFPLRKQASTLDVELQDGTTDSDYLQLLSPALARVWEFAPQLVLYQAGVDGLQSDRLGRLALTFDGLRDRDRLVIEAVHRRAIPLAITIGGGYSDPISDTVRAHAQTFEVAAEIYC